MQASPRLGARSCRGTGSLCCWGQQRGGGAELCVSSASQDTPSQHLSKPPLKLSHQAREGFGSQRKMFSNDSWLSNLASTLLQGCWFKCNYKTGLNAAEKIRVVSQLEQGTFFFFSPAQNISCRPLPLVSSRSECFCPECCLFPVPEGSKSWFFFPCDGKGGLFHAWALEGSLRSTWCATCWGGAIKRIGPRKEIIIISTAVPPEKGKSSAHSCIF